jgi:hypothetical protein
MLVQFREDKSTWGIAPPTQHVIKNIVWQFSMAAEHEDWNRQSEYSDSSPLLMANPASSDHQHVINILPISNSAVPSPEGSESDGHCSLSSRSAPQPERVLSGTI